MTAALALGLSALKSQTATPRPLGSFTLGRPGAPTSGCPAGFTCYNFATICPNIVQTHNGDGHIAIMRPAGAATQLDIFFPPAGGQFWYRNPMLVDPFYQQLIAAGHIVVDVQWSNNVWYSAAPGELAGPEALACRPATVMRWVHDNWLPTGVRYAVIGSSAGSSAVSYSLTTYGLDSLVQLLVPISGPPHARLTYNCLNPSGGDALGTSGEGCCRRFVGLRHERQLWTMLLPRSKFPAAVGCQFSGKWRYKLLLADHSGPFHRRGPGHAGN